MTEGMVKHAGQVGALEASMRLHVYSVFTLMKVRRRCKWGGGGAGRGEIPNNSMMFSTLYTSACSDIACAVENKCA